MRKLSYAGSGLGYDGYFGAADRFAGKVADFAALESNNTVTRSVDGKIAAQLSAVSGALSEANLSDNYLSDRNFLAAGYFNTKPLAG